MFDRFLIFVIVCSFAFKLSGQRLCLTNPKITPRLELRHLLDDDSIISIPVVFHIIYRDSGMLIPQEQISFQVAQLNRDFRRRNIDQEDTPEIFRHLAADCRVEFCLAIAGPDGAPVDGITTTLTRVEEIGLTDDYYQTLSGGQNAWDPERFLNVWVCEISASGDIAGFAQMPGHPEISRDGVVIDYRYFGSGPPAIAPFNQGRTLTHEIGHWLGLEHIWGSEPGCDTDDGIEDTPRQFDRYRGCPDFPRFSCGSEDMFMNFMDLTDDSCMNLFTEGQKKVIRNTLFSSRAALRLSIGCKPQTTAVTETDHGITVSPNPARDYIELTNRRGINNLQISLTDAQGYTVLRQKGDSVIDISHLRPGLYFLVIKSGQLSVVQKIIKAGF
jgi:hypothetical protein